MGTFATTGSPEAGLQAKDLKVGKETPIGHRNIKNSTVLPNFQVYVTYVKLYLLIFTLFFL